MPFYGQYGSYFFGASFGPFAVANVIVLLVLLVIFILWKCGTLARVDTSNEASEDIREKVPFNWKHFLIVSLFWLLAVDIFCTLWAMSAFDIWPIGAAIPVMTIYMWFIWLILMPAGSLENPKNVEGSKYKHYGKFMISKVKHRPVLFICGLVIWFLVAFITIFFTDGICVAFDPIFVTTRYSRSLEKKYCSDKDDKDVCHLFMTLSENPSNSVIVNFHTATVPNNKDEAMVYYDVIPHSQDNHTAYDYKKSGFSFKYSDCDGHSRGIHWVEITGLQPDTLYYFQAGYGDDSSKYSIERKFKTLPESGHVQFVTGGDLGISTMTRQMMTLAASQDPDFVLLGGDIAYANAMPTCNRLWDQFTQWWGQHMVTSSGVLVPLVMAIGNHEAGGYGTRPEDVPVFLEWYPQQLNVKRADRSTFHAHNISDNGLLMVLDSEITTLGQGNGQTNWMKNELSTKSTNRTAKFAIYHVPLYPSYRSYTAEPSATLRRKWVPLFDQYNLTIGFENHDHAYKRTFPLKHDEIAAADEKGTVFVGDGAWGVAPRPLGSLKKQDKWYSTFAESRNFIMKVDLFSTYVNITAIDKDGQVFDQYSHQL